MKKYQKYICVDKKDNFISKIGDIERKWIKREVQFSSNFWFS